MNPHKSAQRSFCGGVGGSNGGCVMVLVALISLESAEVTNFVDPEGFSNKKPHNTPLNHL